MLPAVQGDDLGHQVFPCRLGDADGQMALLFPAVLHRLPGLALHRHRTPGVFNQHVAFRGGNELLFILLENFDPEFLFQKPDVVAHRRLRQVQLLRGFGISPLFHHGEESFNFVVDHSPFSF